MQEICCKAPKIYHIFTGFSYCFIYEGMILFMKACNTLHRQLLETVIEQNSNNDQFITAGAQLEGKPKKSLGVCINQMCSIVKWYTNSQVFAIKTVVAVLTCSLQSLVIPGGVLFFHPSPNDFLTLLLCVCVCVNQQCVCPANLNVQLRFFFLLLVFSHPMMKQKYYRNVCIVCWNSYSSP